MRSRAATVAYGLSLVGLGVAFVVLVIPGFSMTRVWEDEAYNLSVPISLAHGLGYSSSGALLGSAPTLFDYRISTGPVVLVPIALPILLGVDPVVAGRAVMVVFAALLALAAFAVGYRSGGRWGGVVAAAAVLAFNGAITESPIQGLTDVLGELPAAGLTLLAVASLRSRPWLAGMLLGLAMQCKNLAVLSAPALLLVLVVTSGPSAWRRVRRAAAFMGAAALPTALFEAVKLITLGPVGYKSSTRDNFYFLVSGGQTGFDSAPLDKLRALAEPWGLPAPIVVVLVAAMVLLCAADVRRRDRAHAMEWLVAALIALAWCGWWVLAIHQPVWIRHPAPGLLAAGAMAAGLGIGAVRALLETNRARPTVARPVAAIAALGIAAASVVALSDRVAASYQPVGESLSDQRAVAELVDGLPGDRLRGDWGPMVSIALLAGLPPVLASDDRDPAGIWLLPIWRDMDRVALARKGAERACGPGTVRRTENYVVCAAERRDR